MKSPKVLNYLNFFEIDSTSCRSPSGLYLPQIQSGREVCLSWSNRSCFVKAPKESWQCPVLLLLQYTSYINGYTNKQTNKQTNKRYKLTETKRNKESYGRKLNKQKKAKANKQTKLLPRKRTTYYIIIIPSTTIPFWRVRKSWNYIQIS